MCNDLAKYTDTSFVSKVVFLIRYKPKNEKISDLVKLIFSLQLENKITSLQPFNNYIFKPETVLNTTINFDMHVLFI